MDGMRSSDVPGSASIFPIQENTPDTGEHSRYRRTFQIQENIPDTGEHSRYRRTFPIQEYIPDTGEHSCPLLSDFIINHLWSNPPQTNHLSLYALETLYSLSQLLNVICPAIIFYCIVYF